ncbi:MAG: DUF4136 domain-containing protein [Chlorobi bacterium]|nr:DUF4136 domain-containing protein [Chlorobiota bacterium]
MKKGILFAGIFAWLLASCSSVKVTYDRSVDFSRYRTFAYIKDPEVKKSGLPEKYLRIIVRASDRFIKSLGLRPDPRSPDLLVKIVPRFHKRVDVYPGPPYAGPARPAYEGTVALVFIDARTGKKVWEGRFPLLFQSRASLEAQLEKRLRELARKYPGAVTEDRPNE